MINTFIKQNPLAFLLIGVSLISFSPILVQLSKAPALQVGFYRNAFGLLFLLPLVLIKKDKWFAGKWTVILPLLAGVIFFFDLWGWHKSIIYIGPGIATLLGNFQVFFLTLFGFLFLKEKLTFQFVISVPLVLLGIYFIVHNPSQLGKHGVLGVTLGVATALCYSGFLLIIRKTQTFKKKISADMNLLYITVCTVSLFAVAMFVSKTPFQIETRLGFVSLLAYGFIPHFLGWIIISRCLPLVKAGVAGISLLLQPVLSFVWEIIIFQKAFTPLQIVGGVLAVTAIYLGTHGQQNKQEQKE